jgi:hypothetical protein
MWDTLVVIGLILSGLIFVGSVFTCTRDERNCKLRGGHFETLENFGVMSGICFSKEGNRIDLNKKESYGN